MIPTLEQDDNKEKDAEELNDGMFDEILQDLWNINIAEQEIN